MSPTARSRWGWVVVIGLALVDRLIKYYFAQRPDVIWRAVFVSVEYSVNHSLALSLPWPLPQWVLAALMIIIALVVAGYGYHHRSRPLLVLSTAAIALGALSNAFDRLTGGGVIDYLSIANLAMLNLADVLITVGCVGWLWGMRAEDEE